MIIKQIYHGGDPMYPYKYRIELPRDNLTLIETVKDWATDTGFKCMVIQGAVYVHNEKDAIWFVLRWS